MPPVGAARLVDCRAGGARRDKFPTGMLHDRGARKVYVQRLGQKLRQEDLVSTFADADPADLGTVAEQEAFFCQGRDSVFGPSGGDSGEP